MHLSANRITKPPKKTKPADLSRDEVDLAKGIWTEAEYLEFDNQGGGLIEFIDGRIEVLPMADMLHQRILRFLFSELYHFASQAKLGEVLTAPLPIRLWPGQLREPDLLFFKPGRVKDVHAPPDGADLVMEIVSPGKKSRERDLKTKRKVYAKAKIAEYWTIDPKTKLITVFTLGARSYKIHGKYKPGQHATSRLLPGFKVDVSATLAAGTGK
jgi:Uma2 family endonuclease